REPSSIPSTSPFTPLSSETLSSTPVPPSTETPTTSDPTITLDTRLGDAEIPVPNPIK
ncbi:hypothetical protein HAX54_025990, partial [Datura stramonium]|nr:hypothetical protein [Datura stramonium]